MTWSKKEILYEPIGLENTYMEANENLVDNTIFKEYNCCKLFQISTTRNRVRRRGIWTRAEIYVEKSVNGIAPKSNADVL